MGAVRGRPRTCRCSSSHLRNERGNDRAPYLCATRVWVRFARRGMCPHVWIRSHSDRREDGETLGSFCTVSVSEAAAFVTLLRWVRFARLPHRRPVALAVGQGSLGSFCTSRLPLLWSSAGARLGRSPVLGGAARPGRRARSAPLMPTRQAGFFWKNVFGGRCAPEATRAQRRCSDATNDASVRSFSPAVILCGGRRLGTRGRVD